MSVMECRGRARRVRHKLKKVAVEGKLRLSCFRSNTHIYAQIVDDAKGLTLCAASTVDKKVRKDITRGGSVDAAVIVGTELANRAKAAGVSEVYFDRGSRQYAGRVKALADAARAGGLQF
jgi:large subunit ribosomal protein L18